jgi:glucose/arabinose dehydrogenase
MSGSVVRQHYDAITGLKNPHGLAFNSAGTELYVAEETSIKKYLVYSDAPVQTIATLPVGGRHVTRTIAWGPDERLYVSIGSTCDVCVEKNPLHGTIISMKPDGTDQKTIATGLRNAVFFDWSTVDGQMYATDMGRDGLGDDLPPDEINRIKPTTSADFAEPSFGWPYCYGNRVRDEQFGTTYDCATTEPAHINLPAHVAPLGMAFVPEEGWPEEWWYDMLVAEHGSWNSTLDAQGNPEGEPVDFLTGFLENGMVKGRPVDLMIEPGGTLYITDDYAGVVYKVSVGVEM